LLSKATFASQKVLAIERQCKASSRAAWVLKEASETKIELHFHGVKSKEQAQSGEGKVENVDTHQLNLRKTFSRMPKCQTNNK
jgi:hypothetical protein